MEVLFTYTTLAALSGDIASKIDNVLNKQVDVSLKAKLLPEVKKSHQVCCGNKGEWWFELECTATLAWRSSWLCYIFPCFCSSHWERETEKPNMLIYLRSFISVSAWCYKIVLYSALIANIGLSWVFLKSTGRVLFEVIPVGNEAQVITTFYPGSKQKPHLVYSGQNIDVENKGHAAHFETGHGHGSESCTSEMNVLPVSCGSEECGRA